MPSTPPLSRFSISFVLGCFVLICASVCPAQSGRRSPKTSTTPPPVAEPESPDTKPTTAPAPTPSLVLNVGMDNNASFVHFPLNFYADALRTIIERLSKGGFVKVNDLGTITRGDAVNGAKAEKEASTFVVYLDLKVDNVNMDPDAFSQDGRDAIIEYWVFAPGTAKTATTGHTYARAYEHKVGVLQPNSSGTLDNYLVNMAAKAAAERILDYFKTHKPASTTLPSPFGGEALSTRVQGID